LELDGSKIHSFVCGDEARSLTNLIFINKVSSIIFDSSSSRSMSWAYILKVATYA